MSSEQFTAIFVTQKGLSSPVQLELKTFNLATRYLRAGLVLLIGLILSALLIGIPIIHFFAVPIGIVLSLILAVGKFKAQHIVKSGTGTCPACGKQVRIFKRPFKLPFVENCEHCRKELKVQLP